VDDHTVPVAGGRLTVRVYRPDDEGTLPAHILLHGGAWWLGSIDELVCDAVCRYRSLHAHCAVLAVEYRLAPEHRFPTAVEDAYAALAWAAHNADRLGLDAAGISVGGMSAGANLAAAVSLKARDTPGPRVVFQLLEMPVLDLTLATVGQALTTEEFDPVVAPAKSALAAGVRHYLNSPARATHPLASPLLCEDLSGLPPAYVMTAEFDPLRLEGERYARALAAAGTPAEVWRQPGAVHGSDILTRVWPPAREWQRRAASAVRAAHRPTGVHGDPGHSVFPTLPH
jgi:acetyl esterase